MTVKGIGRTIDKHLAKLKEHPHRMAIECALLFVVSFILECILSADTIYTASGRWFAAGATSFLIDSLNLAITAALFSTGALRSYRHFFSAVFGSTAGAMVAVYMST